MGIIEKSLIDIKIGSTQSYANMQVTPLCFNSAKTKDYLILDEAMKDKVAKVVEVSESGNVPELKFENSSTSPILLIDGEELIGAKQNRIVNLTILVGPERTILIPVSCVEAGRWQHESSDFKTSESALYSNIRAHKAMHVTESMKTTGHRRSDQSEVWEHISEKMENMKSYSDTEAMSQMFEDNKHSLDDYVEAFSFEKYQCGAVFSIDGKIKGLELFDNEQSYQKLINKLLRSYALDAIETRKTEEKKEEPARVSKQDVESFMKTLGIAKVSQFPGTDLGSDLRLDTPNLSGGGLEFEDTLIHLCVFPVDQTEQTNQRQRYSRMRRASGRGQSFH